MFHALQWILSIELLRGKSAFLQMTINLHPQPSNTSPEITLDTSSPHSLRQPFLLLVPEKTVDLIEL